MIFEHRTYTVRHGRMDSYLERYEQHGLPLQQQYLGRLLACFVSEIGPLNQVLYIWGYKDLADREHRRAALEQDPQWQAFKVRNAGTFVSQDVKIMRESPFSPRFGEEGVSPL